MGDLPEGGTRLVEEPGDSTAVRVAIQADEPTGMDWEQEPQATVQAQQGASLGESQPRQTSSLPGALPFRPVERQATVGSSAHQATGAAEATVPSQGARNRILGGTAGWIGRTTTLNHP